MKKLNNKIIIEKIKKEKEKLKGKGVRKIGLFQNIMNIIGKIESIDAVYLFGSHSRKEENINSDVDLCIIGNLKEKEKKEIKSSIPEKADVSFFEELPIFIKIKIFSEGNQLFIKEGKEQHIEELKWKTLIEFREFLPLIKIRINEMMKNAG